MKDGLICLHSSEDPELKSQIRGIGGQRAQKTSFQCPVPLTGARPHAWSGGVGGQKVVLRGNTLGARMSEEGGSSKFPSRC